MIAALSEGSMIFSSPSMVAWAILPRMSWWNILASKEMEELKSFYPIIDLLGKPAGP